MPDAADPDAAQCLNAGDGRGHGSHVLHELGIGRVHQPTEDVAGGSYDRAVAMFAGRQATSSQYALLVAMVAYTVGGLVLLLGG